ncbi:MAG: sugar phosphate nucleotidyltransferase [Gemmatimonadaceae bacterium]
MVRDGQTTKVVILARGLGRRMRADNPGVPLAPEQKTVAETGVKAMIPVGRPFLDYVLSEVADAGYREVCLVIGPEHSSIRRYYGSDVKPSRIRIEFAEQIEALGTADAVLAAESFAGDNLFVVLNSDNYYPAAALTALRDLGEPGLVGFEQEALIELGNVPADRVARFGALDIDGEGYLRRILARPDEEMIRAGKPIYSSLNCWVFGRAIFRACREVALSPRGEMELPRAVQLAIDNRYVRFRTITMRAPVLDLSSRADIQAVSERLRTVEVSL